MSRGRIQLASVGSQDEFLTGDPQITYFLKNFKRHTKFALETLQSGFIKQSNSFGETNECFIPRKGDLIRNMYIKVNLSSFGYPLVVTTIAVSNIPNTFTFQVTSAANITVGCYFAGNQGGTDYSFEKDNIKVTNVSGGGAGELILSTDLFPSITSNPTNCGPPATYVGKTLSGGSNNAIVNVIVSGPLSAPTISSVLVTTPGSGYQPGDTVAIAAGSLGTGQLITTDNITSRITLGAGTIGIQTGPFTVSMSSTSGSGFGASFSITGDGVNNVTSLVVVDIGTGFVATNTITITAADLIIAGFTGAAANIVITLTAAELQDSDRVEFVLQSSDFGTGATITVDQPVTVNGTRPAEFLQPVGYTDSIGHALIEYADLIIGGQTVERITGEYMELNSDVSVSDSQQKGLELLVGKTGTKTGLGPAAPLSQAGVTKDYYGAYPRIFMIPLPFYFFRHDSLSIPLSAIDKQEVQVRVKFRNWENLIVNINSNPFSFGDLETTPVIEDLTMVTEYVFLSDDELNYFRQTRIDYIISQLQVSRFSLPANLTSKQVILQFLNPVKELFFVIQNNNVVESNVVTGNDWFNFDNAQNLSAPLYEQLANLRLDFNGQTNIPSEVADAVYLRGVQPMLSHTRGPNRRFYVYSFALDPENDLPTGQVNMSRITNKLLDIKTTENTEDRTISVYAVNFNVLRVQNGLAGVIFNFNSD